MGCSCGSAVDTKSDVAQEALVDPVRYCAYKLPVSEPDYALIYDFQTREGRILKVILNPALDNYTIFICHPLLFVIGGQIRGTKELSNKIWITSAGVDEVNMAGQRNLLEARIKPFAASPKEGFVYVVGGWLEDGKCSKACEKFRIGDDTITMLKPMLYEHDMIVQVGKFIYGMGMKGFRRAFEVFDTYNEEKGWELMHVNEGEKDLEIDKLINFGIMPMDESGYRILIFGGEIQNENNKVTNKEIILADVRNRKLLKSDYKVPISENILSPTTSGKTLAFGLTQNFKLLMYVKGVGKWELQKTNIEDQINKKGLSLLI